MLRRDGRWAGQTTEDSSTAGLRRPPSMSPLSGNASVSTVDPVGAEPDRAGWERSVGIAVDLRRGPVSWRLL